MSIKHTKLHNFDRQTLKVLHELEQTASNNINEICKRYIDIQHLVEFC